MGRTLTVYQRYLGHQSIDAGADIVLGSHPHILQGIEIYQGKVICYSLGNFVFDVWPPFFTDETKESMLLTCLIGDNRVKRVFFRPTVVNKLSQPELVTPGDQMFSKITTLMSDLSAALGTVLHTEGDKIWVLDTTS